MSEGDVRDHTARPPFSGDKLLARGLRRLEEAMDPAGPKMNPLHVVGVLALVVAELARRELKRL